MRCHLSVWRFGIIISCCNGAYILNVSELELMLTVTAENSLSLRV